MSTQRDQLIVNLQAQIDAAKKQLEFLQDSKNFYDFDLGNSQKTVLTIDFNSDTFISHKESDNTRKLTSAWYKNFAGFTTSQETEARKVADRLRNWLKFYRIHSFLTASENLSPIYHVVRYDSNPVSETVDRFIPVQIVSLEEAQKSGEFVFRSITEANQAINYMLDSNTGLDTDLRSLFGIY